MKHVLELDSIRLSFNDRVILSDVYMKCETGKITGMLGRNGQGKSCLMNIVYGELEAEKSIRFDNISVTQAFKKPELLLFLPQFNFLPASLTISGVFNDFDLDYHEFEKRFPEFSFRHNFKLQKLSGGEVRFIQTYIIVKSKTRFSILDEPFTHLMPLQIEKIKELIIEEKQNKGFLITDHLYKQIIDISDYLYVLSNGTTHLVNRIEDLADLGYVRL